MRKGFPLPCQYLSLLYLWLVSGGSWKQLPGNGQAEAFMILAARPGKVLVALQMLEECWALVAVGWMFTSADCSQPGMALSIFWISSPNIHWIFQRGGTGMSSCRRRRSCSLGCVSPPCPFCTPLEKPESFLWNVAQGCFFLQNGSELVQFSCKTFSCLRGPLFKNKGT